MEGRSYISFPSQKNGVDMGPQTLAEWNQMALFAFTQNIQSPVLRLQCKTKRERKKKTIATRHLLKTIVAAVVRADDHTGPRHSRSNLPENSHLYWSKDSQYSAPASLSHPHLSGILRAWHWSSLDVQQVGGCCMSTWKIWCSEGAWCSERHSVGIQKI